MTQKFLIVGPDAGANADLAKAFQSCSERPTCVIDLSAIAVERTEDEAMPSAISLLNSALARREEGKHLVIVGAYALEDSYTLLGASALEDFTVIMAEPSEMQADGTWLRSQVEQDKSRYYRWFKRAETCVRIEPGNWTRLEDYADHFVGRAAPQEAA